MPGKPLARSASTAAARIVPRRVLVVDSTCPPSLAGLRFLLLRVDRVLFEDEAAE